jgi:hypothetical protein
MHIVKALLIMNLIVVLLILLAAWLVYSILQSYRNMEEELRQIRLKCIISKDNAPAAQEPAAYTGSGYMGSVDPVSKMTASLIYALQLLKG